jgi:two-component system KDP operon response regulator KdpE
MRTRHPSLWLSRSAAVQPLVLVVEDERHCGHSLVSILASHGFRTLHAGARASALTGAVEHDPDLVLLDATAFTIDGVGLTTALRDWTSRPILVLLGRGREREKSALLDAGANDYILKPFATSDLLARMRVWLRETARGHARRGLAEARFDRIRIDRDRLSLLVEGREVHLTPLEWKLLLLLARTPGRTIAEKDVLAALWGPGSSTRARHLRAHARQLREKLERDPARPRHLVNDLAGGYRLELG